MTNAPATCPGDGNLLDDEGICGFCGNVPAAFDDEETCPIHRQPVNRCPRICAHGERKASVARRVPPRVAAEQRARDTEAKDVNGLPIAPVLDRFSEDELAAARRMARLHGNRHDLIGLDPGNMGWRFLRDARVALGGKDPGRSPYAQMHTANKRAAAKRNGR